MHRQPLQIGDWDVCASTCTLIARHDAAEIKITPRSMDVLIHLATHAGDVVSAGELLDEFWPSTVASDHAVHKVIAELRSALGDDAHNPKYIRTVPKRGYSLVAQVTPAATARSPRPPGLASLGLRRLPFMRVASTVVLVVRTRRRWAASAASSSCW